ncbi:MAG: glyoxalase/bleomycin resistance/extradiol dioxygenase family protein [Lysinibacillus sp.]
MAINVYLTFDGNCREAVAFYEKVFGVKQAQIMTYGDAPMDSNHPLSKEQSELILHTRLNIFGSNVMFSDAYPGFPYIKGNNISLSFVSDDEEKIKTTFQALQEGGSVQMELQETFWSKCYGQITDKFGIEWQMNYEEQQN